LINGRSVIEGKTVQEIRLNMKPIGMNGQHLEHLSDKDAMEFMIPN
jgi:hypothetical protein